MHRAGLLRPEADFPQPEAERVFDGVFLRLKETPCKNYLL